MDAKTKQIISDETARVYLRAGKTVSIWVGTSTAAEESRKRIDPDNEYADQLSILTLDDLHRAQSGPPLIIIDEYCE